MSIENEKKLQKFSAENENSREEAKQIEDDLADAVNEIGLMLSDGNNLRSNFAANQGDDGSDKSLEIPGSLETDLAKDIDRCKCDVIKIEKGFIENFVILEFSQWLSWMI